MKKNNIEVTSHYEPLHLSKLMQKKNNINQDLINTEIYSKAIVRFPFHLDLSKNDIRHVCKKINLFFKTSIKH